MADVFTAEKRSWIMSRVRGKDTQPELVVRSIVHGMGFRYRLHQSDLPGKPDLVLTRHKKVIFVHGCFWHGHKSCRKSGRPSTNTKFWNDKLNRNQARDLKTRRMLQVRGWRCLVVWECQTKDRNRLKKRLASFLNVKAEGSRNAKR